MNRKKGTEDIKNKICTLCSKISMRSFVFFLLICTMIVIGNVIFDLKAILIEHFNHLCLGKNLICLTMCFLVYDICIWKKRIKCEKVIEKKVRLCIQIFANMCFVYIGILSIMFGIVSSINHRNYEEWDVVDVGCIVVGTFFLLIAVIIHRILFKENIYLWYPISCYCALYAWQTGEYVGGMEGVAAIVALLGGIILFGIIEYSITVFLNLGIPKWIWKYVCGLVLFIILVLLHFA